MMHSRQGLTDSGRSGVKPEEVRRVGKARVYEIAREVGLANKELVSKIQALGIDIKNHMSSVDLEEVQRIKRALEKERQENLVEERISATVIRRRSKTATPKRRKVIAPPGEGQAPPGDELTASPPPLPPTDAAQDAGTTDAAMLPTQEGDTAPSQAVEPDPGVAAGQVAEVLSQEADAGTTAPVVAAQVPAAPGEAAQAPVATEEAGEPDAVEEAKPPAKPQIVHRYAPGFKPGMQYGSRARAKQEQAKTAEMDPAAAAEQAISAADAIKMMAPTKPQVVITDLDGRRPGMRREVVTRKDLFADRRFKTPGKKKKKVVGNKKAKKTEITTPAQHKRVIRLQDSIAVGEIARQMGIKSTEVLKSLWAMGLTNLNINQSIDADTASLLAGEFGYEVEDVSFSEAKVLSQEQDRPEDLVPRSPIITVMGHVDHGKTSLLDAIRNTSVVDGEAGGITQHIGAYKVSTRQGELVFLDTPGHEAFTLMRARGAHCTDVVVLVVAAEDGVMPQTVEAVEHAKDAGVPIIVAVNKIDRPDANPERVRSELSEHNLIPEEWGGETLFVDVSAKTKEGLDNLLDSLILQAELLELRANPGKMAKGTIIESKLDKARGAMCTVLVQEGTLHVGDTVVTGEHMGKVRAMLDDRGLPVKEAGPSTPVEVLGLGGVPQAGDPLNGVTDEKAARILVEHRRNEQRRRDMAGTATKTYEEILGQIRSGEAKEVKMLVKADVHGSSEAVRDALVKLSTEQVSVNVISAGVGGINETDVNLAKAAGAIICGFNVRATGKAAQLAEREGVQIQIYDVIYEMLDNVREMMQGLLPKERREKFLGRAEVRETFNIPRVGVVAGCGVQEGKITRNSLLRLVRDNIKIYDGRVGSLRRFKDDVREVVQGYECGISIEGYKDVQVGDVIEAYEIEEVAPALT